jgi:hypothetical protein
MTYPKTSKTKSDEAPGLQGGKDFKCRSTEIERKILMDNNYKISLRKHFRIQTEMDI